MVEVLERHANRNDVAKTSVTAPFQTASGL